LRAAPRTWHEVNLVASFASDGSPSLIITGALPDTRANPKHRRAKAATERVKDEPAIIKP
jgi:hypothetical protein